MTELARTYYLIDVLAPAETAKAAKRLRSSVEALGIESQALRGARKSEWASAVIQTRASAREFRDRVRSEFNFATDDLIDLDASD